MPYVPVPKDLTKVKNRVLFGLTLRQLLCFGGGAAAGVPFYFLTRGTIGNDVSVVLMIVLMLPFFLFGIYEKDGEPLEKYLGYIIRARYRYPKTRPYETENIYAALERHNLMEKEAARLENKAAGKTGKSAAKRRKETSGRKSRASHSAHAGRKAEQARQAQAGRSIQKGKARG